MSLMIKFILLLFLAIIALVILYLIFKDNEDDCRGLKDNSVVDHLSNHVGPSKILSTHEREMYIMLVEACPKHIVLCQVSFNAFLKCSEISVRNKFSRSMCDFMIVDQDFTPILCIELDDRSHLVASVKKRDEFRDNLLSAASIPTERFYGVPEDIFEIKNRLKYYLNNKYMLVHEKINV